MFIIDSSGSMDPWIAACKTEMNNIIKGVKTQFKDIKIRVAVIGYRDICDRNGEFSIFPFNSDINEVVRFLSTLQAYGGGGDGPEDMAGAFNHALNQKWESESRYAILISDNPCHGAKYHNIRTDSYPQGDPNGLNVEE